MPKGRPTIYTQKLADEICKRIAEGESLIHVCEDDKTPSKSTVLLWIIDGKHEDFSDQYARACNARAEILFEELLDIADRSDQIVKSGAEKKSGAYAQNQRLKVDTRKWYLSKVLPKKFGDKLDVTSDGKALPAPIYGGKSTDTTENKV